MIKIEGKTNDLSTLILIDSEASYNYVNINLVERCNLESSKLPKHRMIQLETGMKIKITYMVKNIF